jgi:hypothetical protein
MRSLVVAAAALAILIMGSACGSEPKVEENDKEDTVTSVPFEPLAPVPQSGPEEKKGGTE